MTTVDLLRNLEHETNKLHQYEVRMKSTISQLKNELELRKNRKNESSKRLQSARGIIREKQNVLQDGEQKCGKAQEKQAFVLKNTKLMQSQTDPMLEKVKKNEDALPKMVDEAVEVFKKKKELNEQESSLKVEFEKEIHLRKEKMAELKQLANADEGKSRHIVSELKAKILEIAAVLSEENRQIDEIKE